MRILVIDPGSTSTKVGVFEEERLVLRRTIAHDRAIVDSFEDLLDQEPMRVSAVAGLLADEGYLARRVDETAPSADRSLESGFLPIPDKAFSAAVGRGGLIRPVPGGPTL